MSPRIFKIKVLSGESEKLNIWLENKTYTVKGTYTLIDPRQERISLKIPVPNPNITANMHNGLPADVHISQSSLPTFFPGDSGEFTCTITPKKYGRDHLGIFIVALEPNGDIDVFHGAEWVYLPIVVMPKYFYHLIALITLFLIFILVALTRRSTRTQPCATTVML